MTTISPSPRMYVHLTEGVAQWNHPLVQNGTVAVMPTIRTEYQAFDQARDPYYYPYAGFSAPTDTIIVNNVADAIGRAKQAGRRCVLQIQGSAKIWTYRTDQNISGAVFGEMTSAKAVTAFKTGSFVATTESARVSSIITAILSRLDANWGGARPDGSYHDIENGPFVGVQGGSAITDAIKADSTCQALIAARRAATGIPTDDFALNTITAAAVQTTLKSIWSAFGPVFMWNLANSTNPLHLYTAIGIADHYPSNIDASTAVYFSASDVPSFASDVAERRTDQPFAPHLSISTDTGYATLQQRQAMLDQSRRNGINDLFLFIGDPGDAAGDVQTAAMLSQMQGILSGATQPRSGSGASGGGSDGGSSRVNRVLRVSR